VLVSSLLAGNTNGEDIPLGTNPFSDTLPGVIQVTPPVSTKELVADIIPGGTASHQSRLNDLAFMDASDDFLPEFSLGSGADSLSASLKQI